MWSFCPQLGVCWEGGVLEVGMDGKVHVVRFACVGPPPETRQGFPHNPPTGAHHDAQGLCERVSCDSWEEQQAARKAQLLRIMSWSVSSRRLTSREGTLASRTLLCVHKLVDIPFVQPFLARH